MVLENAEETSQLLVGNDNPKVSYGAAPAHESTVEGAAIHGDERERQTGESFDNVPRERRQLGLFSVVFLVFNRVIGTGIYATPSVILRTSGSVGVALVMWLIGALIAAAGTMVYVELGTVGASTIQYSVIAYQHQGLPRSGGEKNYLEYIYRHPRFLTTCTFSVYALITGSAAANSVVFGEYVIHSLNMEPNRFNTRFVAFLCLTFCVVAHGIAHKFGLRLQNALGFFKLSILCAISISGLFCLAGVPGFTVRDGYEKPHNFEWHKMWEGSGTGANGFVTGLYSVIWSFIGYSNANYALSEVKDPIRTIKRAAPLAMFCVTLVYMFVNIAYFAVVSKDDILGSRRIVACCSVLSQSLRHYNGKGMTIKALLHRMNDMLTVMLRHLASLSLSPSWGTYSQASLRRVEASHRYLKLIPYILLSTVVQELGREGILPYSSFFASNKPFNAPLAGLFTQYLVSCAFMLAPPPGDAYLFMISLSSYSSAIINTLVAIGLLLLYTPAYRDKGWNPPYHAPKAIVVLFCISNVYLVIVPLIPPVNGSRSYEHLPYWMAAEEKRVQAREAVGNAGGRCIALCFHGEKELVFIKWKPLTSHHTFVIFIGSTDA
ncbi:hypothetical protein H0H92_003419 [Tricholoma furcatifolium]|nr:hypothetical protein H0H92_003419 [Tricholoma furcatifolium]